MYERIWDESDYVIPPAENSAFFIMTNFVLTPNQTRSTCPEDHTELPGIICNVSSIIGLKGDSCILFFQK